MNRIQYWRENPSALAASILARIGNNWSDERFIKTLYLLGVGRKLNLETPQRLTEKLQWLKLYDRCPIYTEMVDKYQVKKFVSEKIGSEYVVPLLGVWDHFGDINFNELPEQFVLKTTHDSGSVIIVKDKANFDLLMAEKSLERSLKHDFYKGGREWPYKDVRRRIIAEQYIPSLGHPNSVEYKITCMNGEVKFVTFCKGPAHTDLSLRTNDHFDKSFNRMPFHVYYKNSEEKYEKPKTWDKMIEISEKLAKGIPYLRVDFYNVGEKIYFGELTFYTWAGFMRFKPKKWDEILGSWLILPPQKG